LEVAVAPTAAVAFDHLFGAGLKTLISWSFVDLFDLPGSDCHLAAVDCSCSGTVKWKIDRGYLFSWDHRKL
jgi:hypothetical protein